MLSFTPEYPVMEWSGFCSKVPFPFRQAMRRVRDGRAVPTSTQSAPGYNAPRAGPQGECLACKEEDVRCTSIGERSQTCVGGRVRPTPADPSPQRTPRTPRLDGVQWRAWASLSSRFTQHSRGTVGVQWVWTDNLKDYSLEYLHFSASAKANVTVAFFCIIATLATIIFAVVFWFAPTSSRGLFPVGAPPALALHDRIISSAMTRRRY